MITPTKEQIIDEISQDPKSLGYANKTLPEQFNLINLKNIEIYRGCKGQDAFNYLVKTDAWDKLNDALEDNTKPPQLKRQIQKFLAVVQRLDYLNFQADEEGNNVFVDNIPVLVGLQIISSETGQGFLLLGKVCISRAQQLWGDDVQLGLAYFCRAIWHDKFVLAEQDAEEKRIAYNNAEIKIDKLSQGIDEE